MNMPQRANNSAVDRHAASRTFKNAARSICNVAAFTDRRMNAELELLGHRDLDLRVFACRAQDANALNATFRSNNSELLFTGILTGLRKIGVLGESMSLAEQCLDVFLRKMNVMCRNLDEKRLLLLRLQNARDIRTA